MTQDEYNKMFHKHNLNLVAFNMLINCDEEVLRLVNAAITDEREACALSCEQSGINGYGTLAAAAAIRARGQG